ncbi:hypothetical protein Vretimale_16402 [Volvox reticuliferus]|uniref:AAR2 protein n=1 Tax=Volvox reticuliferus TaxID=1737510 RepID=A0A8J4GR29_9CHLO|nr:hypothetical protein Vretifemale_17867 [Volvox reticuliferus]GIM13241.1 hypothetical protein Vretimale_16402 [Volvox reticuliferus]
MAFRCGPRFRGIKMLPPGIHFACYSVPGSEHRGGSMGPVTGFFFNITAGSGRSAGVAGGSKPTDNVCVRRYDATEELLMEPPEDEAQQYSLGVRRYEFDWGLAPYNLHAWQQWRDLTSCLHARVVDEIQPVGGNICTAEEVALDDQGLEPGGRGDGVAGRSGREAEVRLRQQLREGQATRRAAATKIQTEASAAGAAKADTPIEPCSSAALSRYGGEDMKEETTAGRTETGGGTEERGPSQRAGNDGAAGRSHRPNPGLCRCFYSEIPRLVKAAGLNPAQLTALNMDRSRQMEALAAARWGGDMVAVVGEMQFAFIAFIFGQSLQGFNQWRALVTLLLNCEQAALGPHAATFATFLAALRAQLSLALSDAAPLAASGCSPTCISGAQGDEATAFGLATHGASLVEEVLLGGSGRDCFLRHHLAAFIEVLREAGPGVVDPRIQHEMTQLRAVLRQAVGWQFDGIQVLGEDDDDEYAPVVVELGPEDMEMTPLADEGVPGVQDMANIRPTQSAGDGITAYTA